MATWKKVIVSGSNAHLNNVTGSSFQISSTQILGAATTTGTIITGSFSGSFAGSIVGGITSATSASVVAITDASSATGTQYITFVNATSGHPSQSVDTGLTYVPSTDTLTLAGDIAVNGGDITTTSATATVFNTNATTVNAFGAATTLTIGNNGTNAAITIGSATSTASFGGRVVIGGDLDVNGTITTVDTTNLLVADKFILLASGSAGATDGGIVVQGPTTAGTGFALGYDDVLDRWIIQDGLAANSATSFGAISTSTTMQLVGVQSGSAASRPSDGTGPLYGGPNYGHGNMWIDTDQSNDIWIYV